MLDRIAPTVQSRVILTIGAAAVIAAACAALFIGQARASLTAQVFHDQDALADMYAVAVEQYLAGSRMTIEALAQQPAMQAPLHPDGIVAELNGVAAESGPFQS